MKNLILAAIGAFCLVGAGHAASLTLQSTVNLASKFSSTNSNFHPQGLGYDPSTGELLYIQQSEHRIDRSDTSGAFTGSTALASSAAHTTSVAADATNYYFTNYTANNFGFDLYARNKTTGVVTAFSSETAAYGGYPIDVRGGKMYRTNIINNTYDWSSLNQIRISNLSSVDTIDQTVTLATTSGIGGFGIDIVNNVAWVLDYSANASIRSFDLSTGALLDVFAFGLDGLEAGLTYADGKVYVYDWIHAGPSTLRTYAVSGISPVPLPATLPLLIAAVGGLFGVRRIKRSS